jgi:predicted PurR-regulated permease PerM
VVFAAMMLFFFFSHRAIYRLALRVRPFSTEDVDRLCKILKRSSYESIMANAIVGVLQATIVTAGAAIFGFSEWSLVFSITFVFAFIPVVGGSSVAFLIALLCLVTGNTAGTIGMLVVGCITGVSDNILRSYLLSSEQQTSSLLCFVSIIGAVSIFGFSGLFIGPFVINMAAQLMPHLLPKSGSKAAAQRAMIKNSQQNSSMA